MKVYDIICKQMKGKRYMKTLKELYQEQEKHNFIAPSLYPRYRVKAGLRNDNGTGVKVGLTKICDVIGYKMIHGQKYNIDGKLIYRGYSIFDLVNAQPKDKIQGFEDAAYLLIFGALPNEEQRKTFKNNWMHIQTPPIDLQYETSNLLNALQIEVLKLYAKDNNPDNDGLEERMEKGLQILAAFPLFTFSYARERIYRTYPDSNKSFAENVLMMIRENDNYTFQEAKTMDTLLMVHADHGGGNNSTFANVVISSTGTDIYSCISAAIGSLKGPKHGGANIKVNQMFETIWKDVGYTNDEKILKDIVQKLLHKDYFDHSGLVYGIGHAIYTKSDPRATIIKEQAEKLAKEKNMMDMYTSLCTFEKVAIETMQETKHIEACANVDFYSGFVYTMLGIEPELFTPLFAISRMAGWIAHHLENRQSNRKLIRPANIYVGSYYQKEETNENNHSI